MTDEQATTMIELLTEIREELVLQRKMIEKLQRPQAILPAPLADAVSPQRFAPPPGWYNGDRPTLDELKAALVADIKGIAGLP